jgi:uncharacterized membrane protein YfcA
VILEAIALLGAGAVVGIVSALFGVGGGILIVPFIVLALGEGQHVAEGTSLLVTIPTALAGVLAHRKRGYVSFPHSRMLALGGVGGAYVGATLALALPGGSLRRVFAVVLVVVGVRTIRNGLRRMERERAERIAATAAQRVSA